MAQLLLDMPIEVPLSIARLASAPPNALS
jgi:hypothetical protein